MDKEKEIEEMAEIARKYSENFANTPYYKGVYTDMEAIYEAGYRKAEEVRKETAKKIADWLQDGCFTAGLDASVFFIAELVRVNYGVEVDE